ncbi:hypothetical protein TNCV_3546711 [Trichonephila clavipes]|nr:hypothetical protein TNCV_3546711 [Trichonephila clavipes]
MMKMISIHLLAPLDPWSSRCGKQIEAELDSSNQINLDILIFLDQISSNRRVRFQWAPSHMGIDGNEKTNILARTTAEEMVSHTGFLTFSKLSSLKNIELNQLGRTPSHSWYFGRNPRGSFRLMSRKYQTAISRFLSGHIEIIPGTAIWLQNVMPKISNPVVEERFPKYDDTAFGQKNSGRPLIVDRRAHLRE